MSETNKSNHQSTGDEELTKKHFWYKVFLWLGIFGIADIFIGTAMKQAGIGSGLDQGLTEIIFLLLIVVLGKEVASSIISVVLLVSYTWWVWIIIAYAFRRQIKAKETEITALELESRKRR